MELEVVPPILDEEREALLVALARAGLDGERPPAYVSPWRAAGLAEATGDEESDGYARSPRRTRGATRA